MTKAEFLAALEAALAGLPPADRARPLEYYGEMIDDRMEDGLDEASAVAAIGSVDEIVSEILGELPLNQLVKARVTPRRALRAWEIILLVLGSPVWLPLVLALAVVLGAVYVVLWSLVAAVFGVVLSFGAAAVAGVLASLPLFLHGGLSGGMLNLGVGLACAGLTILLVHLAILCVRAAAALGRKILLGVKRCFIGKERGV